MNTNLQSQLESVYDDLEYIESNLNHFLNTTSLTTITNEDPLIDSHYVKGILKQLRFLEVYCTEGKNVLKKFKQSDQVDEVVIEKIYKGIYRKCVLEFFSPTDDLWYEDSRASYKNKSSIDFQSEPGRSIINMFRNIEPSFINLREHLDYFSEE